MPSRTSRLPDAQVAQVGQAGSQHAPHPIILTPPAWSDYELIDSGGGQKLERFGPYRLVRPDTQAIWSPALPAKEWRRVDAEFQRGKGRSDDSPGDWVQHRALPEQWELQHDGLRFYVRLTPFRHTGIFPEHSAHWAWMRQQLARVEQPRVLVLFGYTGLYTLLAAQNDAYVCHVDASRPATRWAQANQELSGLHDQPVRWIVDDALKFVEREIRRKSYYDLIVMDPPVFGRGPKGEIWRLHERLQAFVERCGRLLSERAVGLLLNAYATNISPLTLGNVVQTALQTQHGTVTAGEMVLVETGAGRVLPAALYAQWTSADRR